MPQTLARKIPNSKQQECIDNIEGKYLVLAGPGTGKTFTMIERIKSMIEKGVEPSKILCLTFSDTAGAQIQNRLEKELNKSDTNVNIYTYHGFCNEIITENPSEFELSENTKIIPYAVSVLFIKECIDEINSKIFRTKRNDPYFYINDIQKAIDEIKKNRLTKEQYFSNLEKNPDWKMKLENLKEKLAQKNKKGDTKTKTLLDSILTLETKIQKAVELWNFYELYTAKMQKQNYFDFNDMINLVLEKFETAPSFLSEIANKYEYILVDEYQDTNQSQNEIVFQLTLALKSQNVFVVGDDEQIIYTFQGAKLDTIEKFLEKFPDTKIICLKENMRSTQNILDVSRKIAQLDDNRLEINPKFASFNISKALIAKNEKVAKFDKKVRLYVYNDIIQEHQEIADEIANLIESCDCPKNEKGEKDLSQIAILAKSNKELIPYAQILKDKNIPIELKEGKSIFEIKSSVALYYYMQLLTNPELHIDKFFKLALSKPFNVNAKDFEKLCIKKTIRKSLIELLNSIDKNEYKDFEKIRNFVDTFNYLKDYKTDETLKNIVTEILNKTGILKHYINSEINKVENIQALKKVIDEANDFSLNYKKITLEDFVEYLDMCVYDKIEIKIDKTLMPLNAVQLSTYHSAKGREFEYVYMPALKKENWENSKKQSVVIPLNPSEYKNDEQRDKIKISDAIKLMYVGMTRAKHTLRLSYPKLINKKQQSKTKFLEAVKDDVEIKSEPLVFDVDTYLLKTAKALIKQDYDYNRDFAELVDKKLENKFFSPTSINTYLKCPRQFLYDYIFDINTKAGSPNAISYGSAVHGALEFAINFAIKNNEYPKKDDFIDQFRKKFNKLPVSTSYQRTIYLERGERALSDYYMQLITTPVKNLFVTEKEIKLELDGIKFKGIIDRIDKNPDGTYSIYDYKTGSAKDKKVIAPDGEHEDYYNQIALYKYYFEKQTGSKVKETAFIFPEEFTENYVLNLTEDECKMVEGKFKSAINSIKSHNFDPTPDENVCKWCSFKDFCENRLFAAGNL